MQRDVIDAHFEERRIRAASTAHSRPHWPPRSNWQLRMRRGVTSLGRRHASLPEQQVARASWSGKSYTGRLPQARRQWPAAQQLAPRRFWPGGIASLNARDHHSGNADLRRHGFRPRSTVRRRPASTFRAETRLILMRGLREGVAIRGDYRANPATAGQVLHKE